MSAEGSHGRTEMPIEPLPEAAFDVANGERVDRDDLGQTQRDEVVLPVETIDCRVPRLLLRCRIPPFSLHLAMQQALDLYRLVMALSDYERSLGGLGLRLGKHPSSGSEFNVLLVPIDGRQPLKRLEQVMTLLEEVSRTPSANLTLAPPGEEFPWGTASPVERVRESWNHQRSRVDVQLEAE